ncbi:hypothetical protein D3C87_144850 [compost metagenome]
MRMFLIVALVCLGWLPASVWAGAVVTYHGRIINSAGDPVESTSVTFRIRIFSPNPGKCLLYEEDRTFSMAGSEGIFVIPIGDGGGSRTAADPGIVIEKIFANNPNITFNTTTYPNFICNSGTSYTPSILDQRQLFVSFDDHTGTGEQLLPPMDVNYVPLAVSAYDAQHVGGSPASSVLRLSSGTATPLSPANFSELLNLLSGSSTQYAKSGELNGNNLPTLMNGQVLGWSGGAWTGVTPLTSFTELDPSVEPFAKSNLPSTCAANSFLSPKADGSGFDCVAVSSGGGVGSVTSVAAGTGLVNSTSPGNPITATGTLAVNVGTGANQIVQMGNDAKLPALDGSNLTNLVAVSLSSSAAISTSGNISTTGTVTGVSLNGTNTYTDNLYIRSPAAGGNSIRITGPTTPIGANYVLKLPEELPSAGTTKVLASDDAGNLSWMLPSSGSVTSVTGTAPVMVDLSTPAAPRVYMPKATTSVSGYLDQVDWNTFNDKQPAGSYVTTLTGDVSSSGFTAGSVTTAVNKIKGVPISAAPTLDGQVLRYDSGSLVPGFISMLDLRSQVTGSQALSGSCGANKTLTFDSLTDSLACTDIAIASTQVSGLGSLATLAMANNSVLTSNGSGVPSWAAVSADTFTQYLMLAGRAGGQTLNGGTALSENLTIESTAHATKGNIFLNPTGGFVGIGTTAPVANLSIIGHASNTSSILLMKEGAPPVDRFIMVNDMDSAGYFYFAKGSLGVGTPGVSDRLVGITNEGNIEAYAQNSEYEPGAVRLKTQYLGPRNEVSLEFFANKNDLMEESGFIGYRSFDFFDLTVKNQKNGKLIFGTNDTDYMTMLPSGNVGIGIVDPTYKLAVSGDINATGSVRSNGAVLTSDIRFKKDVQVLDQALAKILRLRGVTYQWRTDEFPARQFNNRSQMGVIAQEVEKEFPEAVDTDPEGYKAVNYQALVSPLIEATKEIYREVASIREENKKLKEANASKDQEMAQIKAWACSKDPSAPFCQK